MVPVLVRVSSHRHPHQRRRPCPRCALPRCRARRVRTQLAREAAAVAMVMAMTERKRRGSAARQPPGFIPGSPVLLLERSSSFARLIAALTAGCAPRLSCKVYTVHV